MSKSSVQRIGKGCSGCVFNIKQAELTGGNNKKFIHVCGKTKKILPYSLRMSNNYNSCFISRI